MFLGSLLRSGSTDTSLWTHYKNGAREYCGNSFPDGMLKNQRLAANVITPTTKSETHDVPISPAEIVAQVRLLSCAAAAGWACSVGAWILVCRHLL
jgi:phosphoribosylaminoimidazole-succinocarboxamide synthase